MIRYILIGRYLAASLIGFTTETDIGVLVALTTQAGKLMGTSIANILFLELAFALLLLQGADVCHYILDLRIGRSIIRVGLLGEGDELVIAPTHHLRSLERRNLQALGHRRGGEPIVAMAPSALGLEDVCTARLREGSTRNGSGQQNHGCRSDFKCHCLAPSLVYRHFSIPY
jgi:hypothetical protein